MRLFSRLLERFRDHEYRHGYIDEFTDSYIATQIKVLREQRGMTQADVAAQLGVRQSQLSRWENVANKAWQVRTLKRLAEVFDVALVVRFETFGAMLPHIGTFGRVALERASFDDDPVFSRQQRKAGLTVSTTVATEVVEDADGDGDFITTGAPIRETRTYTLEDRNVA